MATAVEIIAAGAASMFWRSISENEIGSPVKSEGAMASK
jgi:hypothetical protein